MPKLLFLIVLLTGCWYSAFCQSTSKKDYYIKLTSGRVLFGTGDIPGFGISIEGSKNIIKKPRKLVSKLLVGGELSFENGVKKPKVIDPSFEDFIRRSFYHTSNTILTSKISYFPLNKIIPGLNITVGLSAGYSYQSHEFQAARIVNQDGSSVRRSYLAFDNDFIIGYRVSTGYEVAITQKFLAGISLDFSSYNNGDINTLAGLKAGIRL
jgi:hypothetical protein